MTWKSRFGFNTFCSSDFYSYILCFTNFVQTTLVLTTFVLTTFVQTNFVQANFVLFCSILGNQIAYIR